MALCAYLRRGTRQLLRWSSGPLGLWDSGERVSRTSFREGGSGRAGWSGKAAWRGVLTWALPGGLRMRAGGMNDVMVLPKGLLLQTPL